MLENLWGLSSKQVLVVAQTFFFADGDNQVLTPLKKANKRGTSGSDWKRAYQAVKHNRTHSLAKGNLKHLIRAMAALYLLNIYHKDDRFDLGNDSSASSFDERLGSEIFSVKLHANSSIAVDGTYAKKQDFDECVYISNATDETAKSVRESMQKMEEKQKELTTNHFLKTIEAELKKGAEFTAENAHSKIEEIVKAEKEKIGSKFLAQAARSEHTNFKNLKYEAMVNKNQF